MMRCLFSLLISCSFIIVNGQTLTVKSGNESVEHAYVSVSKLSGEAFFMAVTDGRGEVSLNSKPQGKVIVNIQHLSFELFSDTLLLKGAQVFQLTERAIQIEGIVVTGEYAEVDASKAVNRVRLISKEKIQQSGANDLTDILSHQANVRVSQDAVIGAGISLQGLGDNAVKILVDGVPVVGRINGQIDLGQFNVNDIERIEIVEGPMAVNYGTDALAGVINIITTSAHRDSTALSVSTYAESIGQYDVQATARSYVKGVGVDLGLGRRYFDGWVNGDKPFSEPEPIADARRVDDWNRKEQYLGNIGLNARKGKTDFTGKIRILDEQLVNRGMPNISPTSAIAFDDRYHTQRIDNSLNINGEFNDRYSFQQLLSYNYFKWNKNRVVTDLTTLSDQDASEGNEETMHDAWRMRGMLTKKPSEEGKLHYQLGYDAGLESANGQRIEGDPRTLEIAAFASAKYALSEELIVSPGLRATYNESYSGQLTPSLSSRFSKGKGVYRASYGRGFRAPSFKELYLQFVDINHFVIGNPDLSAETSDSYNLSGEFTLANKTRVIKFGFSSYLNQVKNGIELVQSGLNTGGTSAIPFTYVNFRNLSTYGVRVDSDYKTNSYAVSLGAGVSAKEYNQAGTRPRYTPQVNLRVDKKLTNKSTRISSSYTFQGISALAIIEEADDTRIVEQEAFHLWDVNLTQPLFKSSLNVSVGARNLLDVSAVSLSESGGFHNGTGSTSLIGTGRSYFVSLQWNWSK